MTENHCFNGEDAVAVLPRCSDDVHKYRRGAVAVWGGSACYGGAPLLCGTAALYAGAGIVTVCQPEKSLLSIARHVPMALICKAFPGEFFSLADLPESQRLLERYHTLAIGPGIGRNEDTWNFIEGLLKSPFESVVIDADALVLLAGHLKAFIQGIPEEKRRKVILTPHEGEISRLLGESGGAGGNREEETGRLACHLGCVVLRKGAETIVASPDSRITSVKNGVPALATAGSGDVLAGVIAALLAAHTPPHDAACLGAWAHGQAARNLAGKNGRFGLIADNLPLEISCVLSNL